MPDTWRCECGYTNLGSKTCLVCRRPRHALPPPAPEAHIDEPPPRVEQKPVEKNPAQKRPVKAKPVAKKQAAKAKAVAKKRPARKKTT